MDGMELVAVITGANQGLGHAVAEGLAAALPPRPTVYVTGRDRDRVGRAAQAIASRRAKVRPEVLDVRDGDAVEAFAGVLAGRHGGVDVVVSNAAARITPGVPARELVGAFVDTNNLGTARMLRAFGPLLRPGGRLLVVASAFGSLRNLPAGLHERFATERMTLDDVDAVMRDWAAAVEAGRATAEGWPEWMNSRRRWGRSRRCGSPPASAARPTLVAARCSPRYAPASSTRRPHARGSPT